MKSGYRPQGYVGGKLVAPVQRKRVGLFRFSGLAIIGNWIGHIEFRIVADGRQSSARRAALLSMLRIPRLRRNRYEVGSGWKVAEVVCALVIGSCMGGQVYRTRPGFDIADEEHDSRAAYRVTLLVADPA